MACLGGLEGPGAIARILWHLRRALYDRVLGSVDRQRFRLSVFNVGLLVAIPNLIAVIGMVLWSRNSDRTGERYWHAAIACLVGAIGMAVAARAGSSAVLAVTGLSLTAFGVSAAKPPLWS